ncbi:putative Lovastatin nonaketide synthase [Glarea lozoyensis 74030]|uniref:Putative Lovastatin nonaketide synthase n=1 Tax=Glarea lozoyensis (strain ATCC 74030 / MF5533) TaxID=1104152 RepID=H0EH13_GLAL7|nr:putative Lovastatin nonaketide synthase [Glarea lozoyensis 74030]
MGESGIAVAAGGNLILGPELFIALSKLNMASSKGRSAMWDADVDGYGRGEGFVAVVLKRLSDAIRDGDHIDCVIRNTGANQDGRTKGITMPSAALQAELIRKTNSNDQPQYFEAHGTGTQVGDPKEAEAIHKIAPFNGPLKLVTEGAIPWPALADGVPRRASVNSFEIFSQKTLKRIY